MFKTGQDPSRILEDKGLHLVSDTQILEDQVQEVVKANQQAVEDFQKGKEQALQFLIGQVMAKIKGAADPKLVKEIILRIIKT
jgi:aspartyl-tRNA(Asn)/glutamyl-tRNA(Gln) amidotransferase subunit B